MTRAALAKIHIARKELGLDEETYRAILQRLTGQASAAGLSAPALDSVLTEFKRLGWTPKPAVHADRAGSLSGPYARKFRALWLAAWNLAVIDDPSDAAITAFVRRQTGIDHDRWLRDGKDASRVIEALKAMLERGGVVWTLPKEIRKNRLDPVIAAKLDVLDAVVRRASELGFRNVVTAVLNYGPAIDAACARLGALIREARR
jgi:hypothetical protein